jgi:hypothetical protein
MMAAPAMVPPLLGLVGNAHNIDGDDYWLGIWANIILLHNTLQKLRDQSRTTAVILEGSKIGD